jgi:hypothetical protein
VYLSRAIVVRRGFLCHVRLWPLIWFFLYDCSSADENGSSLVCLPPGALNMLPILLRPFPFCGDGRLPVATILTAGTRHISLYDSISYVISIKIEATNIPMNTLGLSKHLAGLNQ